MADTPDITPPVQWKAGAKALHTFQQAAYAAGKSGKAQGRAFSSLKDIVKTIKENSVNTGLSHSEAWRALGTEHAVLRVTLHHESGESIWSELPVDITQKNRSGSREQAQGSAMTYARRYLLLGIYGLANDDEDDDGEATVSNEAPAKAPAKPPSPSPSPKPVTASQPQSVVISDAGLSEDEKNLCLAIIKHPERGAAIKAQFMAKFYPSAEKLFPIMIKSQEHKVFLDEAEIAAIAAADNVPF